MGQPADPLLDVIAGLKAGPARAACQCGIVTRNVTSTGGPRKACGAASDCLGDCCEVRLDESEYCSLCGFIGRDNEAAAGVQWVSCQVADQAACRLGDRYPDRGSWRWGTLHRALLRHPQAALLGDEHSGWTSIGPVASTASAVRAGDRAVLRWPVNDGVLLVADPAAEAVSASPAFQEGHVAPGRSAG